METIREISLKKAMEAAKVYQLPAVYKDTSTRVWAKAFVEVAKYDCTTSYCLAENRGDGTPRILQDFGSSSKIVNILAIYPYDYLKKQHIPDIKKPSEIAIYLIGHGYEKKDIMKMLSDKNDDGTSKTEEEMTANIKILQEMIMSAAVREYNSNKNNERNE